MTATHDDAHPGSLLVVEDSPSDFAVLKAHLRDGPFADSRIDHSATLAGALDRLRDTSYSAVLVDLGLPDSEGLETFDRVASSAGRAAVLVLTGLADERLAEEAVHRGAQDYLVKGTRGPGEIARAVDYAIRRQSLLAELRDARDEQLAAKDRFLSHVSHELRSPLAVVHQFSSLLLDGIGGPLSADQQEFLAVVMRNVGQLRLMIDDLLTVSHAHRNDVSVECEMFPITGLLDETVCAFRSLAERKDITLDLVAGPPLPDVFADQGRVREVLGNLLDNSLKFTPAGGHVIVSAAAEPDFVRVTVRDTGHGISAADLPHIFEQFFQSKPGDEAGRNGLGLGLFVSRDLITRQGGEMRAESELDHGTSISFTLPTAGRLADLEAPQ